MSRGLHGKGTAVALAVEVRGLVKRYGSVVTAVDHLDFSVEEGETYGLLGPNGAGKTTVMRILLGLVKPTSGSARVLGRQPGDPVVLGRVGSMGESAFYPFLSGRDNLRAVARRCGLSDRRVDVVVDRVALSERAEDLFRTYSYGMQQRLGLAVALLKDPAVLVLDEPSNGLDPAGQLEVSRLLRALAEEGRTILLSSHDMEEVERLCGRVGLIDGGRMLAEGSPEQLRGESHLWVRSEPVDRSVAVISAAAGVKSVAVSDGLLDVELDRCDRQEVAAVTRELVGAGVELTEVRTGRRSLREVFLERTGGRTGGAGSLRQGGHRRRR